MYVCIWVCIWMNVYIYIWICAHMIAYAYVCMQVWLRLVHICLHPLAWLFMGVYLCFCIYVYKYLDECMCVFVYVRMYVCLFGFRRHFHFHIQVMTFWVVNVSQNVLLPVLVIFIYRAESLCRNSPTFWFDVFYFFIFNAISTFTGYLMLMSSL